MKRNRIIIAAAAVIPILFAVILYFGVTFEITLQSAGAGEISCEKQRVHLFQSVKIRILPQETPDGTVLKSITVNGKDCTAQVHLQTLLIRCVRQDMIVFAEFESAAGKVKPVNAPIFV